MDSMKNVHFDGERDADKSRAAKADGDARTAGL
jgi:hypothetical protein